jgi:hypothetical protein
MLVQRKLVLAAIHPKLLSVTIKSRAYDVAPPRKSSNNSFLSLRFTPHQHARTSVRPFGSMLIRASRIDLAMRKNLRIPDLNPRRVEFIPREAMPSRTGMCVVVIVPTFTKGEERDPPVVTRIIVGREPTHAPCELAEFTSQVAWRPKTTRRQMPHKTKGNPPIA